MENLKKINEALIYASVVGLLLYKVNRRNSIIHIVNLACVDSSWFTEEELKSVVSEAYYDVVDKKLEDKDKELALSNDVQIKFIAEHIKYGDDSIESWTEFISDVTGVEFTYFGFVDSLIYLIMYNQMNINQLVISKKVLIKYFSRISRDKTLNLSEYANKVALMCNGCHHLHEVIGILQLNLNRT